MRLRGTRGAKALLKTMLTGAFRITLAVEVRFLKRGWRWRFHETHPIQALRKTRPVKAALWNTDDKSVAYNRGDKIVADKTGGNLKKALFGNAVGKIGCMKQDWQMFLVQIPA